MQKKQDIKKRNPIVIEQHFKRALMGIGPIVGVESARIKDNGVVYEVTFDGEQISSVRFLRKGVVQGEVAFTDTPDGRVCQIIQRDKYSIFAGLKNNEVVKGPFVLGSQDSNGDIDSAIHVGCHGHFSIMSGLQWAYLHISSCGLYKTTFENTYPHIRSLEKSDVARVIIKSDEEVANVPQQPVINPEYTKSSLNSQKQAVFSMLGHLSKEDQHEMLRRFLSIVSQAKKRGHRHG